MQGRAEKFLELSTSLRGQMPDDTKVFPLWHSTLRNRCWNQNDLNYSMFPLQHLHTLKHAQTLPNAC